MKLPNKFPLILFAILISSCSNKNKIGFVNITKLYESFEYKKDLSKEYNTIKSTRQRICDSLDFELNLVAKTIETEKKINPETEKEFDKKRKDLFQLNKQYEEDNQALLTTYDLKIIKQLNAYINEYGKKNGYQLLLGADMKGSVLYGDDKIDETDKLIAFVNGRYKGEKIN